MSNSPTSPKKVFITLQSPHNKNKKQLSPTYKKQTFNVPISKLKKTFKDGNIYDHIKQDHQRRIMQNKNKRRRLLRLQEQQQQDRKIGKQITKKQLQICQQLYNKLDKQRKDYTILSDLKKLDDDQLIKIIKVIYFRKEKNSLFDLIYGLWDSDSLGKLTQYYNKQ